MKKYFNTAVKGLLAGIAISIGGWVFVQTYLINKIVAAFLFAIALSIICFNKYYLYTGKVCYLFTNSENEDVSYKQKILCLLIGLLFNYIGVLLMANIIKLSFDTSVAYGLIESKLSLTWYDCLIRGFGCGILVYVAVNSYKNSFYNILGFFILVFSVGVFILSGFEHSIADMFYLSLDNTVSLISIINIICIILGNTLGGLFLPCLQKLIKDED